MNRFVFVITFIAIVILGVECVRPINLDESLVFPSDNTIDRAIAEMGLEPSHLLHEQKAKIIEYNLQFLKSFDVIDYVPEYTYQDSFYLDTSLREQPKLIFDQEKQLETQGYLFKGPDGTYHLMFNYEKKPIFKRPELPDVIKLHFDDSYSIQQVDHEVYLIDHDHEYRMNPYLYGTLYRDDTYALYDVYFSQMFKYPKIRGFIWWKLEGLVDGTINGWINVYHRFIREEKELLLGFNRFYRPASIEMVAHTLSIDYQEKRDS